MVAWRRLAEVPADPGEARAWLLGTARLTLANHRRSAVRRNRLASRLRLALRPEPAVSSDDTADLVRAALHRLGDDDRELLTLIAWEDLTPAQAATVLGIPAATARKRLERARSRLRAVMAPAAAG